VTLELKHRITSQPDWPPSICCVCMADTGRFIDTGSRFPAYPEAPVQRVWLCVPCVEQMAIHTLGLAHPQTERIEALEAELAAAREDAVNAREELAMVTELQDKGFQVTSG
jgi:hypothetical protein